MPAALRVGVLVERRAVEARQRPLVGREVAGHPVEDDADAGLVQPVDEPPEAVGVAEPRVRGEVRRDVVAPRPTERVLHHRHQLDVGEAEVGDVARQLVRQLLPGPGIAAGVALPRREVHLVDRHRLGDRPPLRRARSSTRRRPRCTTTRRPSRRSAGGTSAAYAIGSAFSRHWPSAPRIANLYAVPLPTPGTNSSHTPERPSWRIGCSRPSQLLKSPLTRTPRARRRPHRERRAVDVSPSGPS